MTPTCSFPVLRGPCGRRAVALYTRPGWQGYRCRLHDSASARDYARREPGWHRAECPQTLQEGPGRPEAAGAA